MEDIFLVLISAALINNIVVDQVIGADPALAASRRRDVAFGLSRIMLVLLPLITVITSVATQFVLIPLELQYLQTFVFVLLIIMVVYGLQAWPRLMGKIQPEIFLPLAGINATVLGTVLLNQQLNYQIFHSFIFGLGTAIGFALLLILLTAIQSRLHMADVPAPFKGASITLITLGLISMAFLGLAGLA